MSVALPLTASTRRVLELDAALEQLSGWTQSPPGGAWVRALAPAVDAELLQRRQRCISQMRRLVGEQGVAGFAGLTSLHDVLERVAVAGNVLEPEALKRVGAAIRCSQRLRRQLPDQGDATELAALRARIPALDPLLRQIDALLTDEGEIREDASPELARCRRQWRGLRSRVQERLERMTRAADLRETLRDALVTERAGRFVIPVRADHRDQIEGIVHDTSSTGQTLFMEPIELVGDQNRLASLQAEERHEIQRLLLEVTAHVRAASDSLRQMQDVLAEADALQGLARWANDADAVVPVATDRVVRLRGARHPLIDRQRFVPLDLEMEAGALVITGPNTGGKTVALKTLGLLALLAQCGLPVPAAEVRLPLLPRVYADIGDEQSIASSLSTFSAHLRNIAGFLADCPSGSLVLLDELGTGTDPEEGAALGVALLERFLELGARVVVSTHHDALKAFAHRDPRAVNAAMEFDPTSLQPTYRVRIGRPGRSNALEIASGLGIDAALVQRARGLLRQDTVRLDAVIRQLEQEGRVAEQRSAELEREREQLQRSLQKQEASERDRRSRFDEVERAARAAIRDAVKSLREQATERLAELEARLQAEGLDAGSERQRADRRARWSAAVGGLEGSAEKSLQQSLRARAGELDLVPTASTAPPVSTTTATTASLQAGARVQVQPFGLVGTVLEGAGEPDDSVAVDVGGKRLVVARSQVTPTTAAPTRARVRRGSTGSRHRRLSEVRPEVDLHGMTVEQALEVVDKYIDDAMLADLPSVRLVHGYGTLKLRDAIHRWLAGRRGIAGFAAAPPAEGGVGVTVVRLED